MFNLYTHLQEMDVTSFGMGTRSHVAYSFKISFIAFCQSLLCRASSYEDGKCILSIFFSVLFLSFFFSPRLNYYSRSGTLNMRTWDRFLLYAVSLWCYATELSTVWHILSVWAKATSTYFGFGFLALLNCCRCLRKSPTSNWLDLAL